MLTLTGFYAGLAGVMLFVFSARVIRLRYTRQVNLLDGDDPDLRRSIRLHGNFIEYVPLALILIASAELQGVPPPYIHGMGGALVLGRALHAYGLWSAGRSLVPRVTGMALTFFVVLAGAGFGIYGYYSGGF